MKIYCSECGKVLYQEDNWRLGALWVLREKVSKCNCGHLPLKKDFNLKSVRIHIDDEDGRIRRRPRPKTLT